MNLAPLHAIYPDLAFREMRVMHVLTEQQGVPMGNCGLLEHYWPESDCDCRRVMLTVIEKDHPTRSLASINYAFDPDDPLPGPFIDRVNQQSRYAEGLLKLVKDAILTDCRHLARPERHYAMVKKAAADPDYPACEELLDDLAAVVYLPPTLRVSFTADRKVRAVEMEPGWLRFRLPTIKQVLWCWWLTTLTSSLT